LGDQSRRSCRGWDRDMTRKEIEEAVKVLYPIKDDVAALREVIKHCEKLIEESQLHCPYCKN
jgi:hypothetical protein